MWQSRLITKALRPGVSRATSSKRLYAAAASAAFQYTDLIPGCAKFMEDDAIFQHERPYLYAGPDFDRFNPLRPSNIAWEMKPLNPTDWRSLPGEMKPTLESHSFEIFRHKFSAMPDDVSIEDATDHEAYGQEVVELVKKRTGAEKVVPITILGRAARSSEGLDPTSLTHIDFDMSAWPYTRHVLTEEEQKLVLSGEYRARILNLWRPLHYPVEDYALAILDPHSVAPEDVTSADYIMHDHVFADGTHFKYNPKHRWHYISKQTPDEGWLFHVWDTHPPKNFKNKFNRVGHSSFLDPASRPGCKPRHSVEIRVAVLEPAPYYTGPLDLSDKDTRKRPWQEYPVQFKTMPERAILRADGTRWMKPGKHKPQEEEKHFVKAPTE